MTDIVIPDGKLTRKLREYARRENRSVEEVLESMLEKYGEPDAEEALPGSLALLAQKAIEADIRSGKPVDTAARSREILHNEYADYLKKWRADEQSDTD